MEIEIIMKQIPGYPKYCVTRDGRVFIELNKGLKELSQRETHGYRSVRIRENGGDWKWRKVHRLVAITFMPKPNDSDNLEVCHINGKRDDNRLENLKWDTRKGNIADRKQYDPNWRGNYIKRKLTAEDVEQIRNDINAGIPGNEIAKRWNISIFHVSNIKNGRAWKNA
jgi:hypothetical protein